MKYHPPLQNFFREQTEKPQCPRLCFQIPLPPEPYLPGLSPPPSRHPLEPWSGEFQQNLLGHFPNPALCKRNLIYLFGIDLYHNGFFWEAHEAWEKIWRQVKSHPVTGSCLKGLIQHTAALLKIKVKNLQGAQSLSRKAISYFQIVLAVYPPAWKNPILGIHLPLWIKSLTTFYLPLWNQLIPLSPGHPPLIKLYSEN